MSRQWPCGNSDVTGNLAPSLAARMGDVASSASQPECVAPALGFLGAGQDTRSKVFSLQVSIKVHESEDGS